LPVVLGKVIFHKQFIVNLAKLGISNASKVALLPATCNVLVNYGALNKNIKMAEFSLIALTNFAKHVSPEFFSMNNAAAVNLIRSIGEIMETLKPVLVKLIIPLIKEIKPKLQEISLEDAFILAFSSQG
jgi:hypothetical protein